MKLFLICWCMGLVWSFSFADEKKKEFQQQDKAIGDLKGVAKKTVLEKMLLCHQVTQDAQQGQRLHRIAADGVYNGKAGFFVYNPTTLVTSFYPTNIFALNKEGRYEFVVKEAGEQIRIEYRVDSNKTKSTLLPT